MKLTKLALIIGLASSTLAMQTLSAEAFSISLQGNPTVNDQNQSVWKYSLKLNNESIAIGDTITLKNFGSLLGVSVAQKFGEYFSATTGVDSTGTIAVFTAKKAITNSNQNYPHFFLLADQNSPAVTGLGCLNNACQSVQGPGAAVPEAESALVPFVALGFGYLYRRKKQKNIQEILAPKAQELTSV